MVCDIFYVTVKLLDKRVIQYILSKGLFWSFVQEKTEFSKLYKIYLIYFVSVFSLRLQFWTVHPSLSSRLSSFHELLEHFMITICVNSVIFVLLWMSLTEQKQDIKLHICNIVCCLTSVCSSFHPPSTQLPGASTLSSDSIFSHYIINAQAQMLKHCVHTPLTVFH